MSAISTPTAASTTPASTTAATAGAATTAAKTGTTTGLGSDFNTFLKLLTTQLQNQDPLSPLDTNQFTQQLVEFSQVEQAINTNTKLDTLVSLQTENQVVSSAAMVGKTVELNDATSVLADGKASYSYTLPKASSTTQLTIANSSGKVVWSGKGETGAGRHELAWDGKDQNGNAVDAGNYTLGVAATGNDKSAISASVTTYGKVAAVKTKNNVATLTIGNTDFPMSEFVGFKDTAS